MVNNCYRTSTFLLKLHDFSRQATGIKQILEMSAWRIGGPHESLATQLNLSIAPRCAPLNFPYPGPGAGNS
jgi:hypothetical protein